MAAVGADTDGVELHIGDRVRDEMFGLGTVKGNVACVGGGYNLVVDYESLVGKLVFIRWESPWGWSLGTIIEKLTKEATPKLIKKFKLHQVHRRRQGTGEPAARQLLARLECCVQLVVLAHEGRVSTLVLCSSKDG